MRDSQRSLRIPTFDRRYGASAFATAVASLMSFLVSAGFVSGATNAARFDVPQVSVARIIDRDTPSEADEMWVEACFEVSTLLGTGAERSVRQLLFVIENPPRDLSVVDFSPRTELTTSYASNISRSRKRDRQQSAGVNASVIPVESASLQANATRGGSTSETIGFDTLPPMDLLAASGTMKRGTAAYFKFNATPQTTLEGSRPLKLVYRVPVSWRSGYVYVRCVAFESSSDETAKRRVCGTADFLVTLYVQGDDVARKHALEMSRSEQQLRRVAPLAVQKKPKNESFATKFTSVFKSKSEPKSSLPSMWLNQVLTSPTRQQEFSFASDLPKSVRGALSDFTTARMQLTQLNAVPLKTEWRERATASTDSL